MNRALIICDRTVYIALLAMIFFLPYSFALIAICQAIMAMAWIIKHSLLGRGASHQGYASGFNGASRSMLWPLIAIGLLIVVTMPFSHYPAMSLKKFLTRFLQQGFLMYLVTETVRSRKRLYGVLGMLLVTSFFIIVDGTVQYVWGKSIVHHTPLIYGRVSGPLNHPNDLGTLLVTVLPVVLSLVIAYRKQMPVAWTWAVSVLFLLLVCILGLTFSRGAWVAFAVSMVVLGLFLKRPKVMVSIMLMLVAFLWAYGVCGMSTRIDLSSVSNAILPDLAKLGDLSDREYYWKTAVGVIKHYPWFGCGYNEYAQTLEDMNASHMDYPHNSLLHITAELGLVGLALYGWLFAVLCLQARKVIGQLARAEDLHIIACAIACGILAWLIHSLVDTPWSSLQLGLLLWLLIGVLFSLVGVASNQEGKSAYTA